MYIASFHVWHSNKEEIARRKNDTTARNSTPNLGIIDHVFLTKPSTSETLNGYIFFEKLSESFHLYSYKEKLITSSDVVIPLFGRVFSKHVMSCKITSDGDSLLASNYFQDIIDIITIKNNTASKVHPKTYLQREISISTLSQMLRHVILRNLKE